MVLRAADPESYERIQAVKELDSVLEIAQRRGPIGA